MRSNLIYRPAVRRRVDPIAYQEDFDAIMLAGLGIKASTIAEHTRLNKGQVGYRQKKYNIRLADYREMRPGTLGGELARSVVAQASRNVEKRNGKPGDRTLHAMVRDSLQAPLPTKKESNGRSRMNL